MVPHSLWRWLRRNGREARALVRRLTLERLENRSLLDIRFAVIGDYGTRSGEETLVANMVRDWKVDFVTTTGDNSYSSDYAADVGFHYGEFIGTTFATTRFFPAMGNHEAPNFTDYFSVPDSNYEVSRGPADLFFIDSEQMLGRRPVAGDVVARTIGSLNETVPVRLRPPPAAFVGKRSWLASADPVAVRGVGGRRGVFRRRPSL